MRINEFDYRISNFSDRLFGGVIPETKKNLKTYEAFKKSIVRNGMVYAEYHNYKLLKEMCIEYDIRH